MSVDIKLRVLRMHEWNVLTNLKKSASVIFKQEILKGMVKFSFFKKDFMLLKPVTKEDKDGQVIMAPNKGGMKPGARQPRRR